MNEKYERNISLKTIWMTLVRRYKTILLFFLPLSLVAVGVTQLMMKKTYTSTASLTWKKSASWSQAIYTTGVEVIKSSTNLNNTAEALAANTAEHKPVCFANGSAITANDIASGLTFTPYSSVVLYLTFTFQSSDSSIVQAVVDELCTQSIASLKTDEITKANYNLVDISSPASKAVKTSNDDKYLFLGLAASLAAGLVIGFIDEIISDEVHDKKDVELWGVPSFDLTVSIKGGNQNEFTQSI